MIFAGASPSLENIADARQRPNALNSIPTLDDISFYVVSVEGGKVCDKKQFKGDYINLNHQSGVHMCGDFFAVLSIQYQTIHVMHLKENGSLVDVRKIGYYCYEDDELIYSQFERMRQEYEEKMQKYKGSGTLQQNSETENSEKAEEVKKLK